MYFYVGRVDKLEKIRYSLFWWVEISELRSALWEIVRLIRRRLGAACLGVSLNLMLLIWILERQWRGFRTQRERARETGMQTERGFNFRERERQDLERFRGPPKSGRSSAVYRDARWFTDGFCLWSTEIFPPCCSRRCSANASSWCAMAEMFLLSDRGRGFLLVYRAIQSWRRGVFKELWYRE